MKINTESRHPVACLWNNTEKFREGRGPCYLRTEGIDKEKIPILKSIFKYGTKPDSQMD